MEEPLIKIIGAVILCIAMVLPAVAGDSLPSYELSVEFDLDENLLLGEAVIAFPADEESNVHTEGLNVIRATLGGKALDAGVINEAGGVSVHAGGVLEIDYEKSFAGADTEADPENVGVVGSVVSPEGVSLTGAWYPAIEGLAYYELTATVPDGFAAISEADAITETPTPEGTEFSFYFPHPSEGMTLVAGKYGVTRDTEGGTEIYAYFFEEDAALAREYLDYTKEYIRMYDAMLGAYPFKRFSVVENFLPTGYSMSTFTLLGRDVVRLPFIVKTSLGHEVLHQWFGNSVYGDRAKGNWLEGITTYLADHRFKELEGEGAMYRKQMLADYQSYVTDEKEIALREFQGRVDPATRAVGYGKTAMVFHMLRRMVGDEEFYETLRGFVKKHTFRRASWDDIRAEFEKTSGVELEEFFKQWLKRKGVPFIDVVEARVLYVEGVPNVALKLRQKGEPYKLSIKVRVTSEAGEFVKVLALDEREKSFKLALEGTPLEMVLDPDYDLMRGLWTGEYAPTIARLLGDEKRALVIPEDGVGDYLSLTKLLRGKDFNVMLDDEVNDEDLSSSSVLLLGADGPVHRRLFARSPVGEVREGFEITVMNNPLNPGKVIAIAVASSGEEADAASRKIFHYGKYSHLKFQGGRNVEKDIAESGEGMMVDLRHRVSGVKPESSVGLDAIIRDVTRKDIVYVGESHTDYEDHRVQLDVIRALNEQGADFAIGMEMFQRPFQPALDDYIAGRTTEREFLRASEYFDRWSFNYHLYREILQYARANRIPVVALNLDKDIIKKVSGGGLDALSPEEQEKLPADMDMDDAEYRGELERIFGLHKNSSNRHFQNFYQSQILWDETMAHSVARYMDENPGQKMVVLAGMGHVEWGHGIPKRAYRLNAKSYAILISSNIDTIEPGMADYVLFPEHLKPLETPRLGVMLLKTDDGVLIDSVLPASAAEAARLKKGDIVTSVDGIEVKGIGDVKVGLFDHEDGDTLEVKVLRKRIFGKRKEMAVEVTLK